MLTVQSKKNKLHKLFIQKKVVVIEDLKKTLNTNYSMSVFRYLKNMPYLSSYNSAGRFYTLENIPDFDENNIWHYKDASFSKYGTLKSTLSAIIDTAKKGFTQGDLKYILRCRVQNALNDLLRSKKISRKLVGKLFLYVSAKKKVATKQLAQRQKQLAEIQRRPSHIDLSTTIEILLELLRSDNWNENNITKNLHSRGISVATENIREVFSCYNLKKKILKR